jgi:pyruvate kinase
MWEPQIRGRGDFQETSNLEFNSVSGNQPRINAVAMCCKICKAKEERMYMCLSIRSKRMAQGESIVAGEGPHRRST